MAATRATPQSDLTTCLLQQTKGLLQVSSVGETRCSDGDGARVCQEQERRVCVTTSVPAGHVLWQERAIVCIPTSQGKGEVCNGCLQQPSSSEGTAAEVQVLEQCSACQQHWLCSKCISDGKMEVHRADACEAYVVASQLAEKYGIDEELLQLVAMLMSVPEKAGINKDLPAFCASYPHVLQLLSHTDSLSKAFQSDLELCGKALGKKLPAHADRDKDTVHLIGALKANVHGDSSMLTVGLFPGMALLNHSCLPNCTYTISHGVATVRSGRRLEAGEEVCLHYLRDLYACRRRRRVQLKQARHFDCQCQRCTAEAAATDVLEAFYCPNRPECTGLVPAPLEYDEATSFQCDTCRTVVDRAVMEEFIDNVLGPLIVELSQSQGSASTALARRFETLVEKAGMHAHHEILMQCYPVLAQVCEENNSFPLALRFLNRQLAALDSVLPGPSTRKMKLLSRMVLVLNHHRAAVQKSSAMPKDLVVKLDAGLRGEQEALQARIKDMHALCFGVQKAEP
eukprot:m.221503 g.221503  ORF g.221503 m.221503 type:complete len:512 (+) comp18719_c3_seq6:1363-2898(+)